MAARSLAGGDLGAELAHKGGGHRGDKLARRDWMARMTWKIWDLSAMAPKGQFTRHMPQETHLS